MNNLNPQLTFIFNIVLISIFALSCHHKPHVHSEETKEIEKPELAHNVDLWLVEGTSQEDILAFEKGLEKLSSVPTILTYYWGKPAATPERDVIDHSYDYSINSFFKSLADQDAYQEDPIHLEFIENHNAIWEKVVVYDNVTN